MLSLFSNIPMILTFGGIGVSCFYYSKQIKSYTNKRLWDCLKVYISVKERFNEEYDGYIPDSDIDSDVSSSDADSDEKDGYFPYIRNKEDEKQKIYYSDENNNNMVTDLDVTDANIGEICKKYNDVMFVTEKIENVKYFKRTKDPIEDKTITLIEGKIFLQVELVDIDNSYSISIHKYLENYMVSGNKLFDVKFLKWFIRYYTSKTLSDNYIVKIFDKNINYIEITPNDHILLTGDEPELYEKVSVLPKLTPPLITCLPPPPISTESDIPATHIEKKSNINDFTDEETDESNTSG
jgi:hypothetical protein